MENFLSVKDVEDIDKLIKLGLKIKNKPLRYKNKGRHKTLVLLFFNPSLRTRLSTQKAGLNLGMSVISMNAAQGWKLEFEEGAIMNADKAEHIKEAAAVISQYADIIGVRTFPSLNDKAKDYEDRVIHNFVQYASVPVISLESAIRHPLQSLADMITIEEYKKTERPKVVLTWAPHPRALPQAVSNSFLEWAKTRPFDLVLTHPQGYELSEQFVEGVKIEYDQKKAFENADFIYAKNWSSYNQYGQILNPAKEWMIDDEKMKLTNEAKFMHCLPVRRNIVVADSVINSKNALCIQQANNRTFAAQAVLKQLLE